MRDDLWSTTYREAIGAGVKELDAQQLADEVCHVAIGRIGAAIGRYAREAVERPINERARQAAVRHLDEMKEVRRAG